MKKKELISKLKTIHHYFKGTYDDRKELSQIYERLTIIVGKR